MNKSKSGYQNLQKFYEISNKRLQLDTEFLKEEKKQNLEDLKNKKKYEREEVFASQSSTSEQSKNKHINEENDDNESEFKNFILYIDESEKSSQCLLELKKNIDFKLQCDIYKKENLKKLPTYITTFPYLVDKKTKKGYESEKCLELIKSKKCCKFFQNKKNTNQFMWNSF